tara:strand:- start:306 stop:485 length:180 start_codon:yes stop_codon:yes gene_type:complete
MGLEALLLMEWNEFKGIDLSKLKFLIKRPIVLDTKNILSIHNLHSLRFKFDNVGGKVIN